MKREADLLKTVGEMRMYIPVIVGSLCVFLGILLLQQRSILDGGTGGGALAMLRSSLKTYQADNLSTPQTLHAMLKTFDLDVDDLYKNVSQAVER